MDLPQLDSELRSPKRRSAYLLVGEESHLIHSAKKSILKAIFKEQEPTPDIFTAGQVPLATILDTYKTPSMFSPFRCVVVNEADHLKKKDWEAILLLLKNPPSGAVLLFVLGEKAPAGFEKNPLVCQVECKKLYPNQLAGWINVESKNLGLSISKEAASFLIDCVGCDLGELSQTLQQLFLYVGSRKLIQLEDVEAVAARTAQKSIFELTRAIGEKNPLAATKVLENILSQGEEPLKILALIARHCRLLAKAQDILSPSLHEEKPDFAKRLGVHPFFAKEYLIQARRWSPQGWKRCFEAMFQCDGALKASRHKPQAILEKLIWELTRC